MDLDRRAVPTLVGCFSSHIPLTDQGYHKYQSSGWCNGVCTDLKAPVLGLSNGTQCWCGIELPPRYSKVPKYNCDTPCQGYGLEDCGGGNSFFTVWLTGVDSHVAYYNATGPNSASTFSVSTSSSTHTPIKSQKSTLTTTSSTTKASPKTTSASNAGPTSGSAASASHTKSKPNNNHDKVLGIALGVVLGVLALAVLAVVLWLIRRRRKRTGEYFRNRTPSPAASSTASEVREIGKPGPNHFPNGSTELPTSEHNRESGVFGNSQLHPPVFMNPNLRQSSQATSYDQAFYTPAERGSFSFHGSADEEAELPAPAPARNADPPLTLPPVSMPPPELDVVPPSASTQTHNPFSAEDVGLGFMSADDEGGQRESSILHHYPSASEVDKFDFYGAGERMSQVQD